MSIEDVAAIFGLVLLSVGLLLVALFAAFVILQLV